MANSGVRGRKGTICGGLALVARRSIPLASILSKIEVNTYQDHMSFDRPFTAAVPCGGVVTLQNGAHSRAGSGAMGHLACLRPALLRRAVDELMSDAIQ